MEDLGSIGETPIIDSEELPNGMVKLILKSAFKDVPVEPRSAEANAIINRIYPKDKDGNLIKQGKGEALRGESTNQYNTSKRNRSRRTTDEEMKTLKDIELSDEDAI